MALCIYTMSQMNVSFTLFLLCSLPEFHHLVDTVLENTVFNIVGEVSSGDLNLFKPIKSVVKDTHYKHASSIEPPTL